MKLEILMNPYRLVFTVALLAISGFVAGCTPLNRTSTVTNSPTIIASPEIVPTSTPTPAMTGTKYINKEAGISLILPEGWDVAGPFPVSITVDGTSNYNLYNLGVQPEASGGPGVSHIIVGDAQKLTIEAFVQSQCSTCPIHPIETVILGEVPAKSTIIGGGSVPLEIEWFFMEHNGRLIGLSIHDPETLETLDDVLQTLRSLLHVCFGFQCFV
jgi:hypothetical protein